MDPAHADLHHVFTPLRSGLAPSTSSEELARQISSFVRLAALRPPRRVSSKDIETTGPSLTLIAKIVRTLSSKELPHDVRGFYQDVVKRLFTDPDLTSGLVRLLSFQDRLLSHLAAKCVSSWAAHDIRNHGECNLVWTAALSEAFQTSTPGCALDTHLWVLTEVIKGILRGDCAHKQEIMMKLLFTFEPSLTSLYSELFQKQSEPPRVEKQSPDLEICLCALLDLLEVLTAARMRHGLCSPVQRLTFLRSSALVRLTCSDVEAFAQKRALLLLKRVLVRKAGDDMRLGGGQPPAQDEEYAADLLAMAEAVLREVDAGWLRSLRVKPQASYFGGNREQSEDGEERDTVFLRAVSLILIKSLEIKAQNVRAQGSHGALHVQQYLMELQDFLQQHVLQVKTLPHGCSWVVVVFAEQDDDLMESIKALMALYLYQRSLPSSNPEACHWGCNPHCHFILLLQSLSFDHTVLLDFLISSETCFLEYCVMYLKHVGTRWQGFCDACGRIEDSETHTPSVPSASGDSARPHVAPLVDYESSGESEEEDTKVSDLRMKRNAEETNPGSSVGLVKKVVSCLTELRTVISRLHSRGLFPYNPHSLLKLLTAVEGRL